MRFTGDIRLRILREYDERTARIIGLVSGLASHIILVLLLLFVGSNSPELSIIPPEVFGGSGGGGGGEESKERVIEFGPSSESSPDAELGEQNSTSFHILNLKVISPVEEGTPVVKKEPVKPSTRKRRSVAIAEPVPKRHIRGVGPGSGGGAGGGSGGGIGPGQGYSIDWGGLGSRRLLSGRLPKYPSGTDKEMPVQLEFTVLADGTVSDVIPTRKSDEILEREAISALLTWRFDPLPSQYEQKSQVGRITFNFKLER